MLNILVRIVLLQILLFETVYAAGSLQTGAPVSIAGGPESVGESREQPWVGTKGMVVSDDREASEWGATILRQGGNAVDAAVAMAFMLAVTRPHYASLGGGGFLLYCPKPTPKGPSTCKIVDYREKAPIRADRDMFLTNGKPQNDLAQNSALAIGVPGAPAGLLLALTNLGTLPIKKILSKPIEVAKKGYLFSPHSEVAAEDRWSVMNDEAKKIFGCKGPNLKLIPCPPGTKIIQKDLAHVLETLVQSGRSAFYEGKIAQQILSGIQKAGGVMTSDDFSSYNAQYRSILSGHFEGHEVITMPPPSSGGTIILQLLNYFERAQKTGLLDRGFGAADSVHVMTHAMSLGFVDRSWFLGDPDFVQVPLSKLLSSAYLDAQWKTFRPAEIAIPPHSGVIPGNEPQHTTHLSVIDRDGNAVSLTTTINDNFGSGFVPPGTGIVMNNEMDDFSVFPGVPNLFGLTGNDANAVAAGKRPLSSMSPTIIRDKKGNVEIVIGAAGGPRIITSVFLALVNRLSFGMSLPDAVSAPRFHHQWKPETLWVEKFGFSLDTQEILRKKGYSVEEVTSLGKIHAVERLENGRTVGVPDPRGEGAAEAE